MGEETKLDFPIDWVRGRFPAVIKAEKENPPFAFMDNAGGAQVPHPVLRNIVGFFVEQNVNMHGPYRHSINNTAFLAEMRDRLARFLGATNDYEIIYGLNATTIIRLFATAFGRTIKPGDEIVVSGLEHEANVTPWLRFRNLGARLQFWQPRGPEALLEEGDLKAIISEKTRLLAVTGASNLLGTINDCDRIAKLAHEAGAVLFVDGVHAAPHLRTRVQRDEIDCFVFSGYKVFGAHIGIAACRKSILDKLPSLNHYFLDRRKLELGTQNFEGLAGMAGVLEYFEALAKKLGIVDDNPYDQLYNAISTYERTLSLRLFAGLQEVGGVEIYGISDPDKFHKRTPTAAFNVRDLKPLAVASRLGDAGFGVNDGHLYAARIAEWLGLKERGGVVRASLCHYNTIEETDRFITALRKI